MSKFIIYYISPESFKNVDFWLKEVRNYSNPDILIFLIGNKSDLEESRTVSMEEGLHFYNDYKLNLFCESSAKTGYNIDKIFIKASFILYDEYINNLNESDSTETESLPINDKITLDSISKRQKKNCC